MDYLKFNRAQEIHRKINEISRFKLKVDQLKQLEVKTDDGICYLSSKNLNNLKRAWLAELAEQSALLENEFELL
jgi:hypothetical protein